MESDVTIWTVSLNLRHQNTRRSPEQRSANDAECGTENIPPPPSYDLLYGRDVVCTEDDQPKDTTGEARACIKKCCTNPVWLTFLLVVSLIILTACFVVGTIFINACPREPKIPIYLIVTACVGFLLITGPISKVWNNIGCCCVGTGNDDPRREARIFARFVCFYTVVASCFMPIWLIAGSVWVYGISGEFQSDDPEAADYCHDGLYSFSFWIITVKYILLITNVIVTLFMAVIIIYKEL